MWQFGHWSLLIGLRRASSKRENKRFRERMREKEKEREKPMREREIVVLGREKPTAVGFLVEVSPAKMADGDREMSSGREGEWEREKSDGDDND